MDSPLDLETRRLMISATVTARTRRHLVRRVAPDANAEDLISLAGKLGEESDTIERALGLRFEPAYPGVTAGPQSIGGTYRLLLACNVHDRGGTPIGVVFTALIAGRAPQVSVAPAGAGISGDWRSPGGFH
jgi:hypothetical protein